MRFFINVDTAERSQRYKTLNKPQRKYNYHNRYDIISKSYDPYLSSFVVCFILPQFLASENIHEEDNQRDNYKKVNKPAQCVRRDKPDEPQENQYAD